MKSNKEFRTFCCAVVAFLSVACPAHGDWSKESKLLASGPAAGDSFGNSVCINANLAIVGAPHDDCNGPDSGSAYIYRYDGKEWAQQAKLIPSHGRAGDKFGCSVSIRGDYAIVGAYGNDANGVDAGSAYIYVYDGTNWGDTSGKPQFKLMASDGRAGDWFGSSVSISRTHAIVGAPADDDNGADSGSAYIYEYDGSSWIEQDKITASDGGSVDVFGWSVSIDSGYAIVGAYLDDSNGVDSGSAYIYRHISSGWAQLAKLTASDGQAHDAFGWSVSINSDYAIVGAQADDDNGVNSGSAYIYKRNGFIWSQQAKITPNDGQASDRFGMSVSMSTGYALVGAWTDDDNGVDSGSAYIYRYDGTDWLQQTKLTACDGQAGDQFGISVSICSGHAIVGAYSDDDNGINSGSAYIYRLDGTEWVRQAKRTASDGQAGDKFGWSVSISDDYAIGGALYDNENGRESGSAYIFRYDGSNWVRQAKLTASDGETGDYFGFSVSISGDCAIVGAPQDDDNGYISGSAYIFSYDGSNWLQQAKLIASDGQNGSFFGWSVSMSEEYAIVGAPYDDAWAGSAYIFKYDGTNWLQQAKLTASDGETDGFFGYSVSICGEYAIVGAYYDDGRRSWSGSAYIFRYDGANWLLQSKLIASDGESGEYFGFSVSINEEYAIVGAPCDDDNGTWSGSAYIYTYNGTDWTEQVKLTPSDGDADDLFGLSVSISGEYAIVGAYGDNDNGTHSGSAYIYWYDGAYWLRLSKLTASDGETYDNFGISVSVSGDYAIVGADSDDDNGYISGAAYIYGPSCPATADLDGNCRVDFADFAVFADWWLYGTP